MPENLSSTLRILGEEYQAKDDYEKLALQATREGNAGNWDKAGALWDRLETQTKDDPALRSWHLLAVRQLRELKGKQP